MTSRDKSSFNTYYDLTLTKVERDAIDWVGGRYSHGSDLREVLCESNNVEWYDDGDITFELHECQAWEIQLMRDENNGLWDCFSSEFAAKLNEFCERVV